MKIKNFRLHNKDLFYFFPGWNTLPFFNRLSKSIKHSLTFPSDRGPNRLIPQGEEKRNRGFALKLLSRAGFLKKFFPPKREEL
ncbi:MAG TPA: hypothetical protein VI546_05980 [candidate division Zixibacteria bacterium]|nr:hypothetical protein [candidate division Zixibacteria bacterium]